MVVCAKLGLLGNGYGLEARNSRCGSWKALLFPKSDRLDPHFSFPLIDLEGAISVHRVRIKCCITPSLSGEDPDMIYPTLADDYLVLSVAIMNREL